MSSLKEVFRSQATGIIMSCTSGHDCQIHPENLILGEWYTITINPDQQPSLGIYMEDFADDQKDYLHHLITIFNYLKYIHFKLQLEYSVAGRLHFHGRFKVLDIHGFYLHDLPHLRRFATYSIKEETHPMIWDLYCRKMDLRKQMSKFCFHQLGIPLRFIRDNDGDFSYLKVLIPKKLSEHLIEAYSLESELLKFQRDKLKVATNVGMPKIRRKKNNI